MQKDIHQRKMRESYYSQEQQEQLEAVNQELKESAEQLNEASVRYNQAILARIALRQTLEGM
jgi:hypothetical protein